MGQEAKSIGCHFFKIIGRLQNLNYTILNKLIYELKIL